MTAAKARLKTIADRLANYVIDGEAHDIQRVLQRRALEETADFVELHMPMVTPYANNFALLDAALNRCSLDGLFCEFGVFQGSTLNHIASRVPEKTIYGFDSFEGLPEDWRATVKAGHFKVGELPAVRSNCKLIKGWFDTTVPGFLKEHPGPAAFLHIDSDLYSSAKTVLDFFTERIVPGTIIVFDEYFNYPGWKDGEHKAFGEFVAANDVKFEFLGYSSRDEQVTVRIAEIKRSLVSRAAQLTAASE